MGAQQQAETLDKGKQLGGEAKDLGDRAVEAGRGLWDKLPSW